MEKRLSYKLSEAAAMLGVSITSVRRAIQRGQIQPCRKFRHIIIPSEELRRFLALEASSRGISVKKAAIDLLNDGLDHALTKAIEDGLAETPMCEKCGEQFEAEEDFYAH